MPCTIKLRRVSLLLRYSLLLLFGITLKSYAQEPPSVKFRSRGLFDFGYTSIDKNSRFRPYIADLRLGAKVSQGQWYMKVDVGLSANKISIKDLLFNYNIQKNSITLGSAYEPFNVDMMTSSVDLSFNESASSAQTFSNARRFGLTYYIRQQHYFGAVGVYSDNSVNSLFDPQSLSSAIALTSRHIYRQNSGNNHFQIGGAFSVKSVDNSDKYVDAGVVKLSSCGSSSLIQEDIISTKITGANCVLKTNFEVISILNRWKIQAEATGMYVIRNKSFNNYKAYGAYVQLTYLFGKSAYGFDSELAIPARPNKGFEIVTRIDYVQANDKSSNMFAGEHTDISLGANYYFNNWFAAKFNVNYTIAGTNINPDRFLSLLRLQYTF